ncbi:TonB-dependent receptor [Parabacteroides sp. PF5-9]|uniref:TonB-dependent receptor n=1 Tax=Parabacteroides sp. PF5-9 TaxID=1742404 RepID=UPI0024764DE0|nr:TonB-dependent receptor [Parabacteroides sp. PF5-9]MDH6358510.1 hypothetical protein [Parabacteroides sp. PF5-9]
MKIGRYLFVLFLTLFSFAASAQQNVRVTGKVVEAGNNTPIEQATVRLLSVNDSTFIGGVASSANGNFALNNIRPGNYLLHISFVGYEPLYQPLQISGRTNPVNVGTMELTDGAIQLGAAIVTGKAPEMVVRNDTIEYNAESFKVTEGSMLEDLLKKMPGVEVDSEGKITVNGKEIKKVLVDGKEFFTDDPKVASKNLPSNMVDKVQVLDRLSEMSRMTGFDDGEEETVINLTVKPGMKSGWFGNAYGGYGSKDRYEGNMMVNRFVNNDQISVMGGLNNTNNMGFTDLASTMFSGMGGGGGGGGRMMMGGGGGFGAGNGITSSGNAGLNFSKAINPKLTFGGNARYSHSDNEAISNYNSENNRDEVAFEEGDNYSNNKSDNFGANFRLEWKPDDKTTLLFRPNFSYSQTNRISNGSSMGWDRDSVLLQTQETRNHSKGDGFDINGQLEFSRRLNDDGRILSASFSGGVSDTDSNSDTYNNVEYTNTDDILLEQRVKNENTGFNYRGYLSWVEPLGRNNFMQLTYSINQRKQEQLKNAYNQNIETGDYTEIDTLQSKNYRNNFINQRISLSFKSIREKFNYTLGVNFDPSYNSSENFIGDTTLFKMSRSVFNVSPMAQLRYNFSKQSNLRVDYNGRVSQPSMTQLMPVPDYSQLTNIVVGNPDLKPRYVNNMSIRYQSFEPEKQLAFIVMANGSYTINDIISYSINEGGGTGNRTTTYKNMNGNYNGNLRVIMNTPLKNKKFTINTMTMASYGNSKALTGYRQANDEILDSLNVNKNLVLQERAGIDFRSSYLDLGINGNIRYNNSRNTNGTNNREVFDYGVGGNMTVYLPYDFKIESDISWTSTSGYDEGYQDDVVLWNASASKSFLKGNQATLRFKIYDILKQRLNYSYNVSSTGSSFVQYNTLSSYFMVHFIYRFSIFKGGASMNDMRRGGPGGGREPGGPGGPPPGRM